MSYNKTVCIAHVGDVSVPCGGTNRVITFAHSLVESGFDVHLVVPRPKHEFPDVLRDVKIHTVFFKENGVLNQIPRAVSVSLQAKKISKKENAKLQIEHAAVAGYASLLGLSSYVLDMHDLSFASPLYNIFPSYTRKIIYELERRAVVHASKIITASHSMKEFIVKEWNLIKENITVIPNGYFEARINEIVSKSICEEKGVITFLGTLHQKVDIDKIIAVAKTFVTSTIYIIGDGPALSKLKKETKKHKLTNLILVGQLPYDDAIELLARSEVVIAPYLPGLSSYVSFPVKLLDYAALGKAIVADNIANICDIFRQNNVALVSEPENINEFIENIHRLLESKTLRKRLSYNAKKIARDYAWKLQGIKLVELYKTFNHSL